MARRPKADWNKAAAAFSEALYDAGKQLKKQGETMLTRACENWLDKTDQEWPKDYGDQYHPWFTGTLHDSIATRVADNGRTVSVRYMKRAAIANTRASQAETGTRDYDKIVGYQFGRLFMGNYGRSVANRKGIVAQMTIGVPYAQYVDSKAVKGSHGNHEGYINELQVSFITDVEDEIVNVRDLIVKARV